MLRVRGDAAQIWQDGVQIGNLYRYLLSAIASDWSADAQKYRLEPEYQGGMCEFRFFIASEGKVQMELRAEGTIHGGSADGSVRREAISAEGTKIWIPTGAPQASA